MKITKGMTIKYFVTVLVLAALAFGAAVILRELLGLQLLEQITTVVMVVFLLVYLVRGWIHKRKTSNE